MPAGRSTMRCTRIEFHGFRRLADASTGIDGDLTAFVGFNEAGKTSLLDALRWHSTGGELPVVDRNRSRPPKSEDSAVVRVFFALSDDDESAIADIQMDNRPKTLTLSRNADGSLTYDFIPRPTQPSAVFADSSARLDSARKRLRKDFEASAESEGADGDGASSWAERVSKALQRPDSAWDSADKDALDQLAYWFGETPDGRRTPRDARLNVALYQIWNLLKSGSPMTQTWKRLTDRVPEFVLFGASDRVLESSYDLAPERRAFHPAMSALVRIAGMDEDLLWEHISNHDLTRRETLLERANENLQALFSEAWNQSDITLRLRTNGERLEVLVKELTHGGDVTNISERSDGIRTFVALVAFLAAKATQVPPILLIDEAETHLHYDAQADLVGVLLKNVDASQIIYTTHSPGCLPGDLGTGIRVVARDVDYHDSSLIKNNFWQGEGPGFSPLLFAMGAGAAAFSVCRQAVVVEGPADMVLLPTLIRQATGLRDLSYQIAPGLASAHMSDMRVEEVAARVIYLADGDHGGDDHVAKLKAAKVHTSRIFQLPNGLAAEDLVDREFYIGTVNTLLELMSQTKRVKASDLPSGVPIAKAFKDWAIQNGVKIPGKVEIAYALLAADPSLTRVGKRSLERLHQKFQEGFA